MNHQSLGKEIGQYMLLFWYNIFLRVKIIKKSYIIVNFRLLMGGAGGQTTRFTFRGGYLGQV